MVGDDDQSIYSWKTLYEILEKFESYYSNTTLIKLEQNYRSTNIILNAANKVIKNNSSRKEKNLWSQDNNNEPIVLKCYENTQEEARQIAARILALKDRAFNLRIWLFCIEPMGKLKG